jgi:hypothetical protein
MSQVLFSFVGIGAGIVSTVSALAAFVLNTFSALGSVLPPYLRSLLKIWQVFAYFLIIMAIGMFLVDIYPTNLNPDNPPLQLQAQIMKGIDIAYSIFYAGVDLLNRWITLPLRIGYEWWVIRWNDLLLYWMQCVDDVFSTWRSIDNFFSIQGVTEAVDAWFDFLSECLVKVFVDICTWRIPYVSDWLQDILDFFGCFAHFFRTVIDVALYIVQAITSVSGGDPNGFDWVVFSNKTAAVEESVQRCIDKALLSLEFDALLSELFDWVAENPFTITLPAVIGAPPNSPTISIDSSVLVPPDFYYRSTPISILFRDGRFILFDGFLWVKEIFLSLIGGMIGPDCYSCYRTSPCGIDNGTCPVGPYDYPWYIFPDLLNKGAKPAQYERYAFDTVVPWSSYYVAVRVQAYSPKKYPDNVGEYYQVTNAAHGSLVSLSYATLNSTYIENNCGSFPAILFPDLPGMPVMSCTTASMSFPKFFRAFVFLYRTEAQQTSPGPVVASTKTTLVYDPTNALVPSQIVPEPIANIVFKRTPGQPVGLARVLATKIEGPLACETLGQYNARTSQQRVLRCEACVSLLARLFAIVVDFVKALVDFLFSVYNVIAYIAEDLGVGTTVKPVDISQIDLDIARFRELLFPDQSRGVCRVGISNILVVPSIFAILRSTGCDNDATDIFDVWVDDLYDGTIGCAAAVTSIFVGRDFDSPEDFILNFILPTVLGESFAGVINVVVDAVECGGDPAVTACSNTVSDPFSMVTAPGSCQGVAKTDWEGVSFHPPPTSPEDRSYEGMAGCIRLFRQCVTTKVGPPTLNPGTYAAWLSLASTMDFVENDLFRSFIDPGLICPFVEAIGCFSVAKLPGDGGVCPLVITPCTSTVCAYTDPMSYSKFEALCFSYAASCLLGQKVTYANTPGNINTANCVQPRQFYGALWLSFLGYIVKAASEFIASIFEIIRLIIIFLFEALPDAFSNFWDCIECTFTIGCTPDDNCFGVFMSTIVNAVTPRFPTWDFNRDHFHTVVYLEILRKKRSVRDTGFAFDPYTLPAWNVFESSGTTTIASDVFASLAGDDSTTTTTTVSPYVAAARQGLIYKMQSFEAFLVDHELIYQTYDEAEYSRVVGDNRTTRDDFLRHYQAPVDFTPFSGARLPLPLDNGTRLHVFATPTMSNCFCPLANDASLRVRLESWLLTIHQNDVRLNDVSVRDIAQCTCPSLLRNGTTVQLALEPMLSSYVSSLVNYTLVDVAGMPADGYCHRTMHAAFGSSISRYYDDTGKVASSENSPDQFGLLFCQLQLASTQMMARSSSASALFNPSNASDPVYPSVGTSVDFVRRASQYVAMFLGSAFQRSTTSTDDTTTTMSSAGSASVFTAEGANSLPRRRHGLPDTLDLALLVRNNPGVAFDQARWESVPESFALAPQVVCSTFSKKKKRSMPTEMAAISYAELRDAYSTDSSRANTAIGSTRAVARMNEWAVIGTTRWIELVSSVPSALASSSWMNAARRLDGVRARTTTVTKRQLATTGNNTKDGVGAGKFAQLVFLSERAQVFLTTGSLRSSGIRSSSIASQMAERESWLRPLPAWIVLRYGMSSNCTHDRWASGDHRFYDCVAALDPLHTPSSEFERTLVMPEMDRLVREKLYGGGNTPLVKRSVDLNDDATTTNALIDNRRVAWMRALERRYFVNDNDGWTTTKKRKRSLENDMGISSEWQSYLREFVEHAAERYQHHNLTKHSSQLQHLGGALHHGLKRSRWSKLTELGSALQHVASAPPHERRVAFNDLGQWALGQKRFMGQGQGFVDNDVFDDVTRLHERQFRLNKRSTGSLWDFHTDQLKVRRRKQAVFGSPAAATWLDWISAGAVDRWALKSFDEEYQRQNPGKRRVLSSSADAATSTVEKRSVAATTAWVSPGTFQLALRNYVRSQTPPLRPTPEEMADFRLFATCRSSPSARANTTGCSLFDTFAVQHAASVVPPTIVSGASAPSIEVQIAEQLGVDGVRSLLRHRVLSELSARGTLTDREILNVYAHFDVSGTDWFPLGNDEAVERVWGTQVSSAAASSTFVGYFESIVSTTVRFSAASSNAVLQTNFSTDSQTFGELQSNFGSTLDSTIATIDSVASDVVSWWDQIRQNAWVAHVVSRLKCTIPDEFDGTLPYSITCFPLWPETLLAVFEPLPTETGLRKQIQWPPCMFVFDRTNLTRKIDEGYGPIFDNNRCEDYCVSTQPPGDESEDSIEEGEKSLIRCGRVPYEDGFGNVELRSDCSQQAGALIRPTLYANVFPTSTLAPDHPPICDTGCTRRLDGTYVCSTATCVHGFAFLDPNTNCPPDGSSSAEFPYCPSLDYTPGVYKSCVTDFYWNSPVDHWVYMLSNIPRVYNNAFNDQTSTVWSLFVFVFPVPFLLWLPEVFSLIVVVYLVQRARKSTIPIGNPNPFVLIGVLVTLYILGLDTGAMLAFSALFIFSNLFDSQAPIYRIYIDASYILLIVFQVSRFVQFPAVDLLEWNANLKSFFLSLSQSSILGSIEAALGIPGSLAFVYQKTLLRAHSPPQCADDFCFYWSGFFFWTGGWFVLVVSWGVLIIGGIVLFYAIQALTTIFIGWGAVIAAIYIRFAAARIRRTADTAFALSIQNSYRLQSLELAAARTTTPAGGGMLPVGSEVTTTTPDGASSSSAAQNEDAWVRALDDTPHVLEAIPATMALRRRINALVTGKARKPKNY